MIFIIRLFFNIILMFSHYWLNSFNILTNLFIFSLHDPVINECLLLFTQTILFPFGTLSTYWSNLSSSYSSISFIGSPSSFLCESPLKIHMCFSLFYNCYESWSWRNSIYFVLCLLAQTKNLYAYFLHLTLLLP